jgi:hypothetical protein
MRSRTSTASCKLPARRPSSRPRARGSRWAWASAGSDSCDDVCRRGRFAVPTVMGNDLGAASTRGVTIAALVFVLSGCGSGPLRTDGGQAGAGAGGGGASGGSDAGIESGAGGAARGAGSGGTAGAGGATGGGGAMGIGGGAGSGGASGSGGATGSGGADGSCANCAGSLKCCGGQCLDLGSNQSNCGSCGNRCAADKPYCAAGVCGPVPCGDKVYPAHTCRSSRS